MRTVINIFLLTCVVMLFSCEKETLNEKDILDLGGDQWEKGEIDEWISENFTKPYNIEVKYRWDPSEFMQNRTFTPVEVAKIKPFMQLVKGGVIDVFAEVAGENFVKKNFPKQFALAGSYLYNVDGTIYSGIAESASTVLLLGLNQYDPADREQIKRRLKLIFHELTHILHQKTIYPVEYKMITPGAYTANWTQFSNTSARALGFITAYSMGAPNEDVAELASTMMSEGKQGYEAILASVPESGKSLLRQKESIIVNYFANAWNIDIWALGNRLVDKLDELAPAPLPELYSQLGTGNVYKTILLDMNDPGLSAEIKTRWQESNAALVANGGGRRLADKLALHFTSNNSMQVIAYYFTLNGLWSTPARLQYEIHPQGDGTFKFSYFSGNGGGDVIWPHMTKFLQEWFNVQTFKIDWDEGTGPNGGKKGGLFKADDPEVSLTGELGNLNVTASAWPFTYTYLHDMLGTGADRSYRSIILSTEHAAQSQDFKDLWASAKTYALNNGGRSLKELVIYYGSNFDQVQAVLYYHTSAGVRSIARFNYNMRIDAAGVARFNFLSQDLNGGVLAAGIRPLLDKYLQNNSGVYIDFLDASIASPPAGVRYGAFTRTDNPSLFLFGELSDFTATGSAWPGD